MPVTWAHGTARYHRVDNCRRPPGLDSSLFLGFSAPVLTMPPTLDLDVHNPDDEEDLGEDLPAYDQSNYNPHPLLPGKLQREAASSSVGGQLAGSSALTATNSPPPPIPTSSLAVHCNEFEQTGALPSGTPACSPRPSLTVQIPSAEMVSRPVVAPPVQVYQGYATMPNVQNMYGAPHQFAPAAPSFANVGKEPAVRPDVKRAGEVQNIDPEIRHLNARTAGQFKERSPVRCPEILRCMSVHARIQAVLDCANRMMSILLGVTTCLWCLPYVLSSCKDVEHSCSTCERPIAVWNRQKGRPTCCPR